jgi:hypothetical protein
MIPLKLTAYGRQCYEAGERAQAKRDARLAHTVGEQLQRTRDWTHADPKHVAADVYDAIDDAIREASTPSSSKKLRMATASLKREAR